MHLSPTSKRHLHPLLLSPLLLLGYSACEANTVGPDHAPVAFGIENSEDDEQESPKKVDADTESEDENKKHSKQDSDSPSGESLPEELPDSQAPKESPEKEPEPKGPSCDDLEHQACDDASDDPLHAIGINCLGEKPQVKASFRGDSRARGVRSKFGGTDAFNPREGERFLVLGTGDISKLDSPEKGIGSLDGAGPTCNLDLGNSHDMLTLPAPIKTTGVGTKNCTEDPSLVGKGDCSNSIGLQWLAAPIGGGKIGAFDYSELRIKATVPDWAHSLSFDFAFMTVEYPEFFRRAYNDFFIVWLESKKWTGNISFDKNGQPISLNAGFFDFKDASQPVLLDPGCLLGCDAPELHDTCLAEHASTKWLNTTVGVTPGEEIELVFAIVDLGDSSLDSFAFLDNFRWGCEEQEQPETEIPDPPV